LVLPEPLPRNPRAAALRWVRWRMIRRSMLVILSGECGALEQSCSNNKRAIGALIAR
jgi:hypothetical protein